MVGFRPECHENQDGEQHGRKRQRHVDQPPLVVPGFETVIRTNVKLQTAPAFRKSIYEHAPDSHGSKDYDALTEEMLGRLKMSSRIRAVENAK